MKVLHVTKKYPDALGGDAVVVSNLEQYQRSHGSSVVILTSNCDAIQDSAWVHKSGLKTTSAELDVISPKRLVSLVMMFFRAFRLLDRERPDIIHTHSVDMSFVVSFAARWYRIPVVHTFHVVTFNKPSQSAFRRATELLLLAGTRPATTLVLDPDDVRAFQHAGFARTTFMPNGVDASYWRAGARGRRLARFTFIAVGRLEEQKGFSFLIEAAAELRAMRGDFQLLIVGDGSLHGSLARRIHDARLDRHVFLLGRCDRPRLRDLYSSADVFVLSSLWEGMPLTLLEACAAGLPCVCTDVSGVREIGRDCTLFVPPGDSSELSAAMRRLMDQPATRDALASAAVGVASRCSWEAAGARLSGVYAEALGRPTQ